MPRNLHDRFAEDWMKEMLSDFGQIEVEREVGSAVQTLDLVFSPTEDSPYDRSALGLLGRMIEHPCALEPFRNGVPEWEICNCRHKRFNLSCELHRLARQKPNNQKFTPFNPFLWILTPTFPKPFNENLRLNFDRSGDRAFIFSPVPITLRSSLFINSPKLWRRFG